MSPGEGAAGPFVSALPHCLEGLSTDEVFEIRRTGSEPELNDRLRHAVNRQVRANGWLCEREARVGPLRRVDLHLVEMGSGMTFAAVEAKMRYAIEVAQDPDGVVNSSKGLAADMRKLAQAGPNMPTFLLLWAPYIALARRRLKYARWTTPTDDGLVPNLSLEECREKTFELMNRLSEGPCSHVEVHSGEGEDATLTLDAWLLAVPSTD